MKIYYVRTNGHDMLIADHGDHRHYLPENSGFRRLPEDEEEAMEYLLESAENLAYNSDEWEPTEETVDDLIIEAKILAEIDA